MPFREVTADQKRNLEIAKDIMRDMGFPDSVIKDRAARLFLAFNGIDMDGCWDKAENLVMTIHESIARISAGSFDFKYMENSRESLRDDLDEFRHSGYMKRNPDGEKAPNAGTTRHAFIEEVAKCVAAYGTPLYEREVTRIKRAAGNVAALNKAESKAFGGVVVLPVTGEALEITKKGQGPIIAGIVEEMLPRFGADAQVAYISDAAGDIFPQCGSSKAQKVRDIIETVQPGNLIRRPDVVALDDARRWVFVFEACSSDGPVSERRKEELTKMLSPLGYAPVFVTCFASREKMRKWLPDLAWETEAWCLDNPEHLIHLNGEKFLGPYEGE